MYFHKKRDAQPAVGQPAIDHDAQTQIAKDVKMRTVGDVKESGLRNSHAKVRFGGAMSSDDRCSDDENDPEYCEICKKSHSADVPEKAKKTKVRLPCAAMIFCDECDSGYHLGCLGQTRGTALRGDAEEMIKRNGTWHCPECQK